MNEKYKNIINLEHPEIKNHKRMSMDSRAAQFAPFAALTGYDDEVKETARLTNDKINIDEELKILLDSKIQIIKEFLKDKPLITITYFIHDEKKLGGKYQTASNTIKKIDDINQIIILSDNTKISFDNIVDIQSEILKNYFQ